MKQHINDIDELLGKYLAREASADERMSVESWLAESESNRRYFAQVKLLFEKAPAVQNLHFDTDAAWKRVKAKLHGNSGGRVVTMSPPPVKFFMKIAAGIVLAITAGFFGYRAWQPSFDAMKVTANKQVATDTLPDGSNVVLNKETTLAYSYDKKEKQHKVKLQGEAYFSIHHNDDKTFIVEVGNVLIRDIGTSFNVKAYPDSNTVEVVVEEGEVMFYTSTSSGVYLREGGKGIYYKDKDTFAIEEAEPNVTAYKTKFFTFSDADLGTVVTTLNAVYEKQIVIDDHLKGCHLTVSFNNESLDEIAAVVAETLGLTVRHQGDDVVLEGNGCQ